MMIERGDVTYVHEPWLALTETGEVRLPGPDGGEAVLESDEELRDHLLLLARERPVFVKEVLDYRYPYLYEHPEEVASFTHAFIVREPRPTIASHYAVKPTVTSPEIGFERQWDLFDALWSASGRKPLVIRTERLTSDPEPVVRSFCDYVGLPFMAESLEWKPQDRPEWQRHRKWHLGAIDSTGFSQPRTEYEATVDNNELLRSFYDYHLPFYERITSHAE
ncbi:MAG: hypothetical protein ACJ74O_10700 [Frankiaceae bacterium]